MHLYIQAFDPAFLIGLIGFIIARSRLSDSVAKWTVIVSAMAGALWATYCITGLFIPHEWIEKVWMSAVMFGSMAAFALGLVVADVVSTVVRR